MARASDRLKRGWGGLVVLVFAWSLIFSLARDVWQMRRGFERIAEAERRLEEAEKQSVELWEKLRLVSSESYRERQIRESLNMQREGELVVVLPRGMSEPKEANMETIEPVLANWEKWLKLVWF